MRKIKMVVGNVQLGKALTWAYPNGRTHGLYKIPTYRLTVSGTDDSGVSQKKDFEVFRFGVQCKSSSSSPRVVGLADQQTHIIKQWIPTYSVHSSPSLESGAWQVYDNFLIHDGPDDPMKEVYASIGCIEICNGPKGFDIFNDYIISLSGATSSGRDSKLIEIGRSRVLSITYMKATRPPLVKI